jgi:phosphohistidine phosphatase
MHGPYELYLVRHGVAEARGEAWPDDTKRPLTAEGMSRLRKEIRGLARLGIAIDIVLTSPLLRTKQTAEILAAGFDPRPHVTNLEALAPGGSATSVVSELEKHAKKPRLAIVGHEPGIGELAARLIGARHAVPFKKGAICRIDVDTLPPNGPGDLRWFLPPRVLRAIKK